MKHLLRPGSDGASLETNIIELLPITEGVNSWEYWMADVHLQNLSERLPEHPELAEEVRAAREKLAFIRRNVSS